MEYEKIHRKAEYMKCSSLYLKKELSKGMYLRS